MTSMRAVLLLLGVTSLFYITPVEARACHFGQVRISGDCMSKSSSLARRYYHSYHTRHEVVDDDVPRRLERGKQRLQYARIVPAQEPPPVSGRDDTVIVDERCTMPSEWLPSTIGWPGRWVLQAMRTTPTWRLK